MGGYYHLIKKENECQAKYSFNSMQDLCQNAADQQGKLIPYTQVKA